MRDFDSLLVTKNRLADGSVIATQASVNIIEARPSGQLPVAPLEATLDGRPIAEVLAGRQLIKAQAKQ